MRYQDLSYIGMSDKNAQSTLTLQIKPVTNSATLDVTNFSLETVIFNPKEMLGL